MSALHQLEFFLLRYAGDITKGESINLGVAVIGPQLGQAGGFADVRFTRNLRRLHCFDPLVDMDELAALESEIRRDLQDPQKRAELLNRMNDAWSNLVQFQPLQGSLGESPAKELERLSSMYLETPTPSERRELSGRQRILAYMKNELERAGVLPFMQPDTSIAEYAEASRLSKVDFGYPSGGAFKFLQAVSLRHRIDDGVIWAKQFPEIAASMKSKRDVTAWMTAVVEDDLAQREEANVAVEMMQESGIVVAPAAKMPEIAEGIRIELKASL